ncbi:enoyl-CoA hydratase/isomerase family protein [bacterium]|nr:enoyl-CoA hydratase/isomerase family protein [bacterium]
MSDLQYLKLERDGHVATVFLNRPKQLNALNMALMDELVATLELLDNDDEIRAIVLTGDSRAFAAGADIMEMADADSTEMLRRDQFAKWDRIRKIKKPIIAAVSGFALGGGCELMMHCDMVIASETAQFGQPEIKIGVMPGAGGTQRLTRTVGKARAMEMVLTGKFIGAKQAEAWGLVNRVVPIEVYLTEAQKLAREIAQMSPIAVRLAKEAVLKNYESFLTGGLEFERKNFYLLFATEDQKEGMKAFIEKRPAKFTGK